MRIFLCFISVFAFFSMAFADEEIQDIQTRIKHYAVDYKVNDDASFVEKHSWTMQVLKEQALEEAKQFSFSYSTSIQSAEVLEAYTLKADGKKIDVAKDNFQVTAHGGKDKNKAIFSDRTTMVVVFSNLEVGDSVVLTYSLTANEPIFPKHFSVTNNFYKHYAYDDLRISIDAPVALGLRYEINELKEEKNKIANGRQQLVWSWKNTKPVSVKRQDFSVYNFNEDAGFSISSFKSHEDIAQAYASRAIPKAMPTDRIKKLANELTKNKNTPDEIAHALYDWVATKIDYAGNCVGLGAVVPHDTDFILDTRMGDCKDHATLLQALLAAKNIESTQALVNAGAMYQLPKIPVVSMVNHVINYIPSMNLFLDSTASYVPYRMLPLSVQGKPVLLVTGYQEGMQTPIEAIGSNTQTLVSTLKIRMDGTATGQTDVKLKGSPATDARYRMRKYTLDNEKDLVKNNFKGIGKSATGVFNREDPTALTNTYEYNATYEVKELFKFTKSGAINIRPIFFNPQPISQFLADAYNEENNTLTYNVACGSGKSSENFTYEFPKEIQILSIPSNVDLHNETLTYQATYHLEANKLSVSRIFDDQTKGPICSPSVIKKNYDLIKKAAENYEEQVIYKTY